MKKVFQPNVRKVYGATPQESQINAVRKIHNLLSSGAVTVTGPTQPRILKQKFVGSTGGGGIVQHQQNITNIGNQQQQQHINMHHQSSIINSDLKCYVCDEPAGQNYTLLNEATTSNTQTKLPNKIGQIVGDAFMVIISCEDVLCKRCTTMINHYDRLETDIERVKTNILNYLYKKYGLSTDDDDRRTQYNNNSGNNITTATIMSSSSAVATTTLSPPIKMQKLNTTGNIVNRRIINNNNDDDNHTRKITIHNIQTNRDPIENQLSTLFESGNLDTKTTSHTSAVQQIKILSPQQQQQQQQPPKRGPIKIYKCMSCEFKTTDLKQFQPHYETCKQQNLQNNYCKICKKQFTNTMLFKQHMTEKHNQSEFSCPVCYIKFLNDVTLKKHIEINHPDLKPVNEPTASQLYACNMCHYMTSDKPNYDEHMRKHVKVKPFKCRLCSTRFETREQASIHAKSHQPNYYKCGTCSASFTQRELLVKHFETHQQNQQQQQQQQQQQVVQQQKPQQQSLTTQKLLQETIDEALRESDHVETKGIHFFSCNICSLTFIQENYYNQHMETHKKDGSNNGGNVGVGKKTIAIVSTSNSSGGGGSVGQTSVGGSTVATVVSTAGAVITTSSSQSLIRQEIRNTNILTTAPSGVVNSGITSHSSNSNSSTAAVAATISEADIESIFEKMHSDKSDNDGTTIVTTAGTTTTTGTSDSLVITSQENAVGGITFNITIPQPEHSQDKKTTNEQQSDGKSLTTTTNDNISVGISMPVLDQPEESSSQHSAGGEQNKNNISETNDDGQLHQHQHHHHHQQNTITDHHQQDISQESTSNSSTVPVSMPSLDDDGEATGSNEHHEQHNMQEQQQHHENEHQHQQDQEQQHHDEQQQHHQVMNSDQVAMELEDMQNSVESGQIKFILNENGQILQLDNHIITTDADGNQILVEGTDSEQIQQLLQSVGVLQSGGGLVDGETLQMIQGENNQMIIVQQGEDGHQLIDASLLNADGHIVIQQSHHDDSVDMDGTTHHQAHAIDEDGVRIPVSVAYTADGQQIVQATTSEHQEQQQHIQQQQQQHDDDNNIQSSDTNENIGSGGIDDNGNTTTTGSSTTTQSLTQVAAGGGNGSEEFFALDDLKI